MAKREGCRKGQNRQFGPVVLKFKRGWLTRGMEASSERLGKKLGEILPVLPSREQSSVLLVIQSWCPANDWLSKEEPDSGWRL
jgi:hypothetical protein